MLTFHCSGRCTDMIFMRAREKVQYEVDLTEMVSRILDHVLASDEVSTVGVNKVVLGRPLDKFWFVDNRKYWGMHQYLRMRARSGSRISLFFVGWNYEAVHAMPSWRRSKFFAFVPNWWSSLEP